MTMKIDKRILFIYLITNMFFGCNLVSEYYENGNFAPVKEIKTETEENDHIPEKKLTLIIYMAADNDLESYAISNLKQMEHADFSKMNVIVLLDRAEGYDETNENWTDTRLFEIQHDGSSSNFIYSKAIDCPPLGLKSDAKTELNLGDYNVLKNLLNFVQGEYETEKYALIIWGHGTGWKYSSTESLQNKAVAIDDKTGTFMSVYEEGLALEKQNLSVIGFDTCFGGVFENIYELKDCSKYIVGTSDITPAIGWNYTYMLEKLSVSDFSEESIAKIMAESSSVNMSVVENSKLSLLMEKFDAFSELVSKSVTSLEERNEVFNQLINLKSFSYTKYPCELYLDLYSMADFYSQSENSAINASAGELKNILKDAGYSTKKENLEIGVFFISKISAHTVAVQHPEDYFKSENTSFQSDFIKDSNWWVPTVKGNSGSLLDKLFYVAF